MKIPEDVRKLFDSVNYMAFATSDKNGKPNVVTIGAMKVVDDETIWVIDTYFGKTKKNILENPQVSMCFWEGGKGYQVKGVATCHEEGDVFGRGKKWVLKLKPNKIVKGVVEIKVKEIYSIAPRPGEAGKRIEC